MGNCSVLYLQGKTIRHLLEEYPSCRKTSIRMEGRRPIRICCVEYVEYQIRRLRLLLQEDFGEVTDMLSCTHTLCYAYIYVVLYLDTSDLKNPVFLYSRG